MTEAIKKANLDSRYSVADVRKALAVVGLYPGDVIGETMSYDSLLNFAASRTLMVDRFHPTTFEIRLYEAALKNVSKEELETLLSEIMTEEGRDKTCEKTARLYKALKKNSVLTFMPEAPVYLYHSRQDDTVPFENSVKAESFIEKRDIRCDFGNYGHHTFACVRFILTVYNDL